MAADVSAGTGSRDRADQRPANRSGRTAAAVTARSRAEALGSASPAPAGVRGSWGSRMWRSRRKHHSAVRCVPSCRGVRSGGDGAVAAQPATRSRPTASVCRPTGAACATIAACSTPTTIAPAKSHASTRSRTASACAARSLATWPAEPPMPGSSTAVTRQPGQAEATAAAWSSAAMVRPARRRRSAPSPQRQTRTCPPGSVT